MLGIVVKGHRRKVGQGTGTEYDFHEEEQTIYVTPAQMAGLIVVFFAEIASPKTIYHALLGRLLKKRWAVMSLNSEKDLYRSRLEGVLIPPYDKVSS